ncbi:MAG TPA: TlpA disulfide reductase family protein [Anaerolineae bacterium]|nr:TlpA disulfide reductase family protein [Anaerolineae bacterium]
MIPILSLRAQRSNPPLPLLPLLLTLTLLLAACADAGPDSARGIDEGDRATDFALTTLDGDQVSLDDYLGSAVLLNFWATWCAPCEAEVPDLEAAYRAHQADGLVILGVSVQEKPESVRPFVENYDVTYPILLDTDGKVMNTYRPLGLPTTIVIDREGIIRARHMGLITPAQIEGYVADLLP